MSDITSQSLFELTSNIKEKKHNEIFFNIVLNFIFFK